MSSLPEVSHVNIKTQWLLNRSDCCCELSITLLLKANIIYDHSKSIVVYGSFRNDSFPAQWLSTAEISLGITEWFMSTERSITLIFLHLTTVSKAKTQLLQCIQGKKTGKGQH